MVSSPRVTRVGDLQKAGRDGSRADRELSGNSDGCTALTVCGFALSQLLSAGLQQEDEGSCSDYGSRDKPGTVLGRTVPEGNVLFPDIFHTDHLLFYERFKAYQDYILGK